MLVTRALLTAIPCRFARSKLPYKHINTQAKSARHHYWIAAAVVSKCLWFQPTVTGIPIAAFTISRRTITSSPSAMSAIEVSNTPSPGLPQPPFRYMDSDATPLLDLTDLGKTIQERYARRDDAYQLSRDIKVALTRAHTALEMGQLATSSENQELEELVQSVVKQQSSGTRIPREANLSARMEDYIRYRALVHFLETGRLISPLDGIVTDEEYVGGACIGLSQDLARYAIGRATARDVTSVQLAHDVVQSIFELLLQFDFRNGPLRRKYDGTKYALKTLETTLYELSITGGGSTADNDTIEEPESKRPRTENDTETVEADARIPTTEINELRKRMEHRDELRERLIKKSRDGQKAAKQAIFALHRSDVKRAGDLIADCEKCIQTDLYPIVMEEPNLRYGCFANVLEEYAEAKLFYAWLHGEGELSDASSSSPVGLLLRPDQFSCVTLEPADYLGGLCDLTGEIGRFAVQRGAARDSNGVRQCLEANMSILASLQMMEREPQEISKKMDQLRRSVQKLERMLYEISLVEATGGTRKVETSNDEQGEDN